MHRASARAAVLLAALFATQPAGADIPNPANSTIPTGIVLVGETGGVPDPLGLFTVTVRDLAYSPIQGASVAIHFEDATDLSIANTQSYPGLTLNCDPPGPVVFAETDVNGVATFIITGAVVNHHPDGNAGPTLAEVRAEGILLGTVNVASHNLDGEQGVSTNDVYLWFCDFGSGLNPGYADYNHDASVTSMDLTLLLEALGGRGSTSNPDLCVAPPGPPAELVLSTGGLKLEKMDCTTGGSANYQTDFCVGPISRYTELVFSIDLLAAGFTEDVVGLTGFEATVRTNLYNTAPSTPLPAYWRFDSPSGCHRTGITMTAASPSNCLDPIFPSGSTGGIGAKWPHPVTGDSNSEELRLMAVGFGPACGNTIPADGNFHPVFAFRINHNLTCTGCADQVIFALESLRFTTIGPAANDCFACRPGPQVLGPGAARRIIRMVPAAGDPVVVFADENSVGVPASLPLSGWWVGAAEPNPSRGAMRLALRLAAATRLRADVHDLAGRRVARLADREFTAGDHALAWDGGLDDGSAAGDGVYFVRVQAGERVETRTIVLRH